MRIKLPIPLPKALLSTLDEALSTKELPSAFAAVTTDSRLVKKGDLFIALRGKSQDGNDYLEEAHSRGAALLIGERPCPLSHTVKDSALFMAQLASLHLSLHRPYIVAVVGSVGKTTTKEYAARALSVRYRVHKTEENENNLLGLARTLLSRPKKTDILIAELGSNHRGEIALLSSLLSPDAAILTAIGQAHLGLFGSEEAILLEKTSVLKNLKKGGIALLNGDDPRLRAAPCGEEISRFFVSQMGNGGLCAESAVFHGESASFTLRDGQRALPVSLPLVSPAGLSALLFAVALSSHLGIGWEAALSAFSEPITVKGRQQIHRLHEYTIIDDTYNASPESMKAALALLLKLGRGNRRIAILGDMAELGDGAYALHRNIGHEAALAAHRLFAFGSMAKAYERGAIEAGLSPKDVLTFQTAADCLGRIKSELAPRDMILIKASHVARGNTIAEKLIKDASDASK